MDSRTQQKIIAQRKAIEKKAQKKAIENGDSIEQSAEKDSTNEEKSQSSTTPVRKEIVPKRPTRAFKAEGVHLAMMIQKSKVPVDEVLANVHALLDEHAGGAEFVCLGIHNHSAEAEEEHNHYHIVCKGRNSEKMYFKGRIGKDALDAVAGPGNYNFVRNVSEAIYYALKAEDSTPESPKRNINSTTFGKIGGQNPWDWAIKNFRRQAGTDQNKNILGKIRDDVLSGKLTKEQVLSNTEYSHLIVLHRSKIDDIFAEKARNDQIMPWCKYAPLEILADDPFDIMDLKMEMNRQLNYLLLGSHAACTTMPRTTWVYGKSGLGKSSIADYIAQFGPVLRLNCNEAYDDMIADQKWIAVFVNDFDGTRKDLSIKNISYWKQLFGGDELNFNRKYKSPFCARLNIPIFVSSNTSFTDTDLYKLGRPYDKDALIRRVREVNLESPIDEYSLPILLDRRNPALGYMKRTHVFMNGKLVPIEDVGKFKAPLDTSGDIFQAEYEDEPFHFQADMDAMADAASTRRCASVDSESTSNSNSRFLQLNQSNPNLLCDEELELSNLFEDENFPVIAPPKQQPVSIQQEKDIPPKEPRHNELLKRVSDNWKNWSDSAVRNESTVPNMDRSRPVVPLPPTAQEEKEDEEGADYMTDEEFTKLIAQIKTRREEREKKEDGKDEGGAQDPWILNFINDVNDNSGEQERVDEPSRKKKLPAKRKTKWDNDSNFRRLERNNKISKKYGGFNAPFGASDESTDNSSFSEAEKESTEEF